MDTKSVESLKKTFANYYKKAELFIPTRFEKREFAFVYFENPSTMLRHIAFSAIEDLKKHIKRTIPRHVFYSSAIYEYPDASNMNEKAWLGAELIFDIDVDHINTPCKKLHDKWYCLNCGFSGWGLAPQACYKCGSERIKRETWVCETCISVARDESLKLIDFLISDFGFCKDELLIVFSGHRGFHIHVYNETILKLDQDARREIADYIRGNGIHYKFFIPVRDSLIVPYSLDFGDPGWLGRISRALYNFFVSPNLEEKLKEISGQKSKIQKLISLQTEIVNRLEKEPPDWSYLGKIIDEDILGGIFRIIIEDEGVKIDERVTIDVKRLIRLPGSLHGKTGLKVTEIGYQELENFEIGKYAVVLPDNYVKIRIKNPPQKILDISLQGEILEVPFYAYIYLLANGAEVKLIKPMS